MKQTNRFARYVEVLDTTLRDGEQTPGVAYTPAEKFEIARLFIALRNREFLTANFLRGQPASRVAFADARIRFQVKPALRPVFAEHPAADRAVRNIRLSPFAKDRGSMAVSDSDIMQHRPVRNQLSVQFFSGLFQNFERLVPHLFAVGNQKTAQRRILRIEMFQNCQ